MRKISKLFLILGLILSLNLISCGSEEDTKTPPTPIVEETVKTYEVIIDGVKHKVIEGQKAPLLQPKDTEDKIFTHFESEGVKFDIDTLITKDVEIKSVFRERKNYTVYFDSEEVTVKEGFKVQMPTNPTKVGYTFYAWFNGNKPFDFETEVYGDIYLTSKWVKDELMINEEDFISLGTIGGVNSVLWNSYYYRSDDSIYFKFASDLVVDGHYALGLFLQLGDEEKVLRNDNTFLIQTYVSERISIYHYPNNIKKEIITGEKSLNIGIVNKITRNENGTEMIVQIPYSALKFLDVRNEFEPYDVIGLSMTADQMKNVVSDLWDFDLKGYNNKNLVDRYDPRDYIRISYGNVLFNYNNNTADTFISGNVGDKDVIISLGEKQTISDENGNFSLSFIRDYDNANIKLHLSKKLYSDQDIDLKFIDMVNAYTINTKLKPITLKLDADWTEEVKFTNNGSDLLVESISLMLDEEIDNGLAFKVLVKKTLIDDGKLGIVISDSIETLNTEKALIDAVYQGEFKEVTYLNEQYLEAYICLYNYSILNSEQLFVKAYLQKDDITYSSMVDLIISDIAHTVSMSLINNRLLELKYLTYTLNYDGIKIDVLYKEHLEEIHTEPKLYQKLLGWYDEEGIKWDFANDVVKGDITLHSQYEADYSTISFTQVGLIGGQTANTWETFIALENNYIITKIVTNDVLASDVNAGIGFLFHFGEETTLRTDKTYMFESYVLDSKVSGLIYNYPNNVKKKAEVIDVVKNLVIEDTVTTMYMLIPLTDLKADISELTFCVISVTGNNTDVWTFNNQVVIREIPIKYVVLSEDKKLESYAVTKEVFELLASKTTAYQNGKKVFLNMATLTTTGTLEAITYNANLFSNRLTQNFIFDRNIPLFLNGMNYTYNKIEGGNFTVKTSGYVILMVPDNGSYQSLNNKINNDGWVKVLSKFHRTGKLTDDISYYIKWCEADETYTYGKWNIAITQQIIN